MKALLLIVSAWAQPPQAPPAQPPQAPATRSGEWVRDPRAPGQVNYTLNGEQIGAYRLADNTYMELRGGAFVPAVAPPGAPLASVPSPEVPVRRPFAEDTTRDTSVPTADASFSRSPVAAVAPTRIAAYAAPGGGTTISNCST